MKIVRIVISILLVFIMTMTWFVQVNGSISESLDMHKLVSEGDKYFKKNLFQKATISYKEAIEINPEKDTYEKLMIAARKGYKDSVFTLKDAENMMLDACNQYPKEVSFWEDLVKFSFEEEDYKSAYNYLNKAQRLGAKSDKLTELNQKVSYTFTYTNKVYSQYFRSPDGYYTVVDDDDWGILDSTGEWFFSQDYTYSSPIGLEKTVALSTEKDTRIYDEDGIVLSYLPKEIKEVKAIEGYMVPVKTSSGWKFYQYESEKYDSKTYDDVSSFTDGVAAVLSDDSWELILEDGKSISNKKFDEVKLHSNGDRSFDDVMIASEKGQYGMYDKDCKKLNSFQCKDADIYMGGAIAFADETDKWGFVDNKGEVIIKPKFDNAKSFSNNLAAVCKDGLWGFIDTSGELVIDYQFLDADYFTEDGMAMVSAVENQYIAINLRFPKVLEE